MASSNQVAELLANEIARKIQDKIQTQQYAPGQRLTVRRLCEEYGASETPVKQALNQLVTTGLVVSIPKCGMRVRQFSFAEMKENWEARLMVELYCAAAAVEAARHDDAFVARVQELLETANQAYENCIEHFSKENFNLLQAPDRNLHTELVTCCRNRQIIEIYNRLNAHAGMFVGYEFHSRETLAEVIAQHTQMVDQLLLCDLEGLRKAIHTHIYSTIRIYRAVQSNT